MGLGLQAPCPACCASVHVASRVQPIGAVSSTAPVKGAVDSKNTSAPRPPKLPSKSPHTGERRYSRSSVHLMRDGEMRNSFEMTGSSEMFSTTPDIESSPSTGRRAPPRHLWNNSASNLSTHDTSEEDYSGENGRSLKAPAGVGSPYGISASCEFDGEPDDSPAMAPSKVLRRRLSLSQMPECISRGSRDDSPGNLGSAGEVPPPTPTDAAPASDTEAVSPGRAEPCRESTSCSEEEPAREDSDDVVTRKPRPKKLLTHDFAVVRTLSRQGWDVVMQQPFQSRQFSAQELAGWIPVNNGQLLGFTSQKGGQPRLASQDEYAVLHEAGYQIYLVVDGHGENGEAVAKFVRRWLVNALQNMVRQRDDRVLANGELTRLFSELHQTAQKAEASLEHAFRYSGCTAAVAVVTPTRSLRGAWLGNCQCVVGRRDDIWAARSLTPPHEGPSNGLPVPVARAIGDFNHESLGHEAEEFVEADIDQSGLDFLIMGTGGLWRGLSQVRIVEEVAKAGPYFAQHACSRVAMLSQDNQMIMQPGPGPMGVEDATIIVVWVGGNVSESEVKQ